MKAAAPAVLLVDEAPERAEALQDICAARGLNLVVGTSASAAARVMKELPAGAGALRAMVLGPGEDQLTAARQLHRERPDVHVILLAADEGGRSELRRTLRFDPFLRGDFTLLALDGGWAQGAEAALALVERRLRHRETIDKINEERTAAADAAGRSYDEARVRLLEEARAARIEAQESRALLDMVIEQSGDAIVVSDSGGTLRVFNAAAERLHGVERQEISSERWSSTYNLLRLDGTPMPYDETPLYRAVQGELVEDAEWLVRRPDGQVRTLRGTAVPLRAPDGTGAGAVLMARDETERLRLERERERDIDALEETARVRERFLGIVSHDLRNPLTAISMAAQLLLRRATLDEGALRMVQRIVTSSDAMERMIHDLLDFMRARSDAEFPIARVPGDIIEICRNVAEEITVGQPEGRITFDAKGSGHGAWDPDRITQLMSNLVGNALRHGSQEAPVTLAVDASDAGLVEIRVHNQGEPISEALLPEIFSPFRQAIEGEGSQNKDRGAGLGLGLFIARQVALAHGGDLSVTSTRAEGTTFRARLPRHP